MRVDENDLSLSAKPLNIIMQGISLCRIFAWRGIHDYYDPPQLNDDPHLPPPPAQSNDDPHLPLPPLPCPAQSNDDPHLPPPPAQFNDDPHLPLPPLPCPAQFNDDPHSPPPPAQEYDVLQTDEPPAKGLAVAFVVPKKRVSGKIAPAAINSASRFRNLRLDTSSLMRKACFR